MLDFTKIKNKLIRAKPEVKLTDDYYRFWYDPLCVPDGYVALTEIPEIKMAINKIAELVGQMTIHLKQNSEGGDKRIVNGLSRIVDISPTPYHTRQVWIQKIIRNLLLTGNAFAIPKYDKKTGDLLEIYPINSEKAKLVEPGIGKEPYAVKIGELIYSPSDILHFVLNPRTDCECWGQGYEVELKDIKQNLKSASNTRRKFLENKVYPSLIISMNTSSDAISSEAARKEIINKYFTATNNGTPWIVPEELFKFDQIKPLTLKDIAITETMVLDRKMVGSIFGLPSFLLGEGRYDPEEFNNFIKTKISVFTQIIEQELTKKLLYSPYMYFKFNPWNLYSVGFETLIKHGVMLRSSGIVTANEVRDWINLQPVDGLDDFAILENYIPVDKVGDQKKLKESEENE